MPLASRTVSGSDAGHRWAAVTATPSVVALAGLAYGYGGFREASLRPVERRELPSTEIVLVVNLAEPLTVSRTPGHVSAPAAFVTGLGHSSLTTYHAGQHSAVEVRIPAAAARPVLGVPGIELAEQVLDLSDLWGAAAVELVERLAGQTWEQRFAVLESVLLARTAKNPAPLPDPFLLQAHDLLLSRDGDLPMRVLLETTGWSRRRLATQFREHLGMTPKTLARLARFRHAERLLRAPGHRSFASIALTCGYYDQAHLNRDFREFAGCTPTAHLEQLRGDTSGAGMATAATPDLATQTSKTQRTTGS